MLLCLASIALLFTSALAQGADSSVVVEHRTAELMEQILTAVSAKTDDGAVMQRLCGLVNDIEASVIQMSKQETADNEYTLAHLYADLEQTKSNLSTIRVEYNLTSTALRNHQDNMQPLPQQLESARTREEALLKQRELLSKECEQDVQGQRFRVDAVKTDISVLDEALKHLQSLRRTVPSDNSVESVALLEVDENLQEPKCVIPEIIEPVVRCQNGYYIPLSDTNGTITTLPPGNGMMYSQRLKCGFRISPANAGVLDRVELTFHFFDTAKDIDVVEIYDGELAVEDKLIARLSGKLSPPPSVRSTGNEMTVLYVTGAKSEASPGFIASYKALQIPIVRHSAVNLCSGTGGVPLVLTGQNGFIAEDTRPEFADAIQHRAGTGYAQSLQCAWIVQTMPGESVRLHFTFLNTEPNADYLTVYDGSDTHAPILLRTSGADVPTDLFSSASSLLVTYNADYTIQGNGFHAAWCVNGTSCPDNDQVPELPSPVPAAIPLAPRYNATAQVPAPITMPTATPNPAVYLYPPEYPPAVPAPQMGSCCVNDCSNRGQCSPATCLCSCFTGFSGFDCSVAEGSMNAAANNLLEMESGIGSGEEALMFHGERIEDECGDDVQQLDNTQAVKQLNLDPVTSLLERLKFELFRSLAYEHDTTNITKRQCTMELQQQDQDLAELQREVLMLGNVLSDMDAHAKALIEKRDSLLLTLNTYQTAANDLIARIDNSKNIRESRDKAQGQELKTLQGMRDLITHIGEHPCTRDVKEFTTFAESTGVECYGELLEAELHTDDIDGCKSLCSFGCVGFTFHSHEGCKFFSSIRQHTTQCAGGSDASCSCFEKA